MVMLSKAELQNVKFYTEHTVKQTFTPIKNVDIVLLNLHEICDILQLWGKAAA